MRQCVKVMLSKCRYRVYVMMGLILILILLPLCVECPFKPIVVGVAVKLDVKFRMSTSVSLFPSCCHEPEYEFVALEKSIGDSDERSVASFEEGMFWFDEFCCWLFS